MWTMYLPRINQTGIRVHGSVLCSAQAEAGGLDERQMQIATVRMGGTCGNIGPNSSSICAPLTRAVFTSEGLLQEPESHQPNHA